MPEELLQRLTENDCIDKLARKITGMASCPEFSNEKIPTSVAAEIYGKSATWVITGIVEGWLPIGHATKSANRTNVYISPKKLWEDTGYIWRGGSK